MFLLGFLQMFNIAVKVIKSVLRGRIILRKRDLLCRFITLIHMRKFIFWKNSHEKIQMDLLIL